MKENILNWLLKIWQKCVELIKFFLWEMFVLNLREKIYNLGINENEMKSENIEWMRWIFDVKEIEIGRGSWKKKEKWEKNGRNESNVSFEIENVQILLDFS